MRFLFSKSKDKLPNSKHHHRGKEIFCAVWGTSETGPVRDHNEDSIIFSFPEKNEQNLIAVVADGMGGHNAGEVASKMACNLILNFCLKNWKQHSPEKLLGKAYINAHEKIVATGKADSEKAGMGTTASSVIVKQGVAYIGHIGDSRIYLLRNGSLTQLSKDHTLVNQMFESGEISEEERDHHPMKNVLTQALGTTPSIQPLIPSDGWELYEGDRLMLCSDGVYDVLSLKDITDLLLMKQPEFVLECLSTMANYRNASDNFSALLIDISSVVQSKPAVTKEQNLI